MADRYLEGLQPLALPRRLAPRPPQGLSMTPVTPRLVTSADRPVLLLPDSCPAGA